MQFDAEERASIEASFRMLALDSTGATECFYRHLFDLRPDLRGLFVTDMKSQGVKLAQTLQVVVEQIGQWGLLRSTLEDLAIRHLAYGVQPGDYDAVGEALVAMLRERLGDEWSDRPIEAWRKAFGGIREVMVAHAYLSEDEEWD